MTTRPPSEVPAPPQGDVDKGPLVNIFDTWIVALDVVVIILRFVTRIWITEPKIWWDDWFIFVALICIMIGASGNAVEVHYGFGRPEHFITDHELRYYLAWTYGEWIQTMLTLMCTKVSICFFLLRVPATASRKLAIPLWIAIVILLVSNIILTLLWAFQCSPVEAVWRLDIHGKCFSRNQVLQMILAQALVSIVSDFGLSLFPIVFLYQLNMKLKPKIGISIVMGLGIVTGSCSIVRTVLNGKALAGDATYGGLTNWFWRLFEVDLGLICACVPTLVPLYKYLTQRLKKSYTNRSLYRYFTRPSFSHGRPSISRGSRPSRRGTNETVSVDRNHWNEPSPRKPSNALLASRTERALMGRAGAYSQLDSTLKTEREPELELKPITEASAEGARGQEWEHALKMPWGPHQSDPPPAAPEIAVARNTSLSVTFEPKTGAARRDTSGERMESSDVPDQMDVSARQLGFWRRLGLALKGGETPRRAPRAERAAWRRVQNGVGA